MRKRLGNDVRIGFTKKQLHRTVVPSQITLELLCNLEICSYDTYIGLRDDIRRFLRSKQENNHE